MSVVIPFAGSRRQGEDLMASLADLVLREADEIVVADNSPDAVLDGVATPPRARVVPAPGEGSPAHARNCGAAGATGEWLLFLDSDCRPAPDLLDAYFDRAPSARAGVVAGAVGSDPAQTSLAAEFAATRGVLDQRAALEDAFMPWAMTANALVRTEVWRELGGFLEGVFNGEDVDFCWRAQRAGWELQFNGGAKVVHLHRETVRDLLRQAVVRRASAHWVHARWPEAPLPPVPWLGHLARSAVAVPLFALAGQPRRAGLKALDAAVAVAELSARARDNRARPRPAPAGSRRPVQIWVDAYPTLSETFVTGEAEQLSRLGHPMEVLAWRRPDRPMLGAPPISARYLEDETPLRRATAMAELAVRRPRQCLRDLVERRRWRAQEAVPPLRRLAPSVLRALRGEGALLHAHFAGGAALAAMRTARIAGRPWTLTAHAYDIYKTPRNLELKLRSAALVTSGCDYTVRDLKRMGGSAARVERVVMGIDPERFRRHTPYTEEATVLAVGRLVEKKGFIHLVRAAAQPQLAAAAIRVLIVGEGPEREALEREIGRLGLAEKVELLGRREPEEIRGLLEHAAVLAMPCVVASDGDRDSMPVVVKEAMAMEVPPVVSHEVGLPELLRPVDGRLVEPGDPAALAAALAEVLALAREGRMAIGHCARARVIEVADIRRETARLSHMLERVRSPAS